MVSLSLLELTIEPIELTVNSMENFNLLEFSIEFANSEKWIFSVGD